MSGNSQPDALTPMLEGKALSSGYGTTPILFDVSLSVSRGEIVAIVGRNGVGKSTLMKTLMGLIPTTGGQLVFENTDITNLPAHSRARTGIGYVPQGRGVFPTLTVEENLSVGLTINKNASGKSLDIAFEYFPRLHERKAQKAGSLSGGEQSMLALGRALVGRPKMLLLDEPSEGIQPNIVQSIGEDIRKINEEMNVPVLFVEQNLQLISAISHRGYVIDKGRIINELDVTDIRDQDLMTRKLAL